MAWRIHQAVVRGEVDNRIRGVVTGKFWMVGIADPIELELEGDCWRDIAGCLLTFENPDPQKADEHTDLNLHQGGQIGDMTASRKVRVFDIPLEEALDMIHRGEKPPEHMGNGIYLEWYSDFNGRVVIESSNYRISISEPAWQMDEADETRQREKNGGAIFEWIKRLTGVISASDKRNEIEADNDAEGSPDDDKPMNEFEWEKLMKESDKRTDKLMELYEKYEGVEDEERERLIAREMGWEHIEEHLDSEADEMTPEPKWDLPDFDKIPDPKPNPLTEGIDWVRNKSGHPVHPLYLKCFDLISDFRSDCKDAGWLSEGAEDPLRDLIFSAHMINAKLAGALNSLWRNHEDGGLIVACLKRSLKYFNEAMGYFQSVQTADRVPKKRLQQFHADLCGIREEILRLMDHYRNPPDPF